jgi:hypothetical protein
MSARYAKAICEVKRACVHTDRDSEGTPERRGIAQRVHGR